MIHMTLKELLIREIAGDEAEYCFDRKYCSDKSWENQNGTEERMGAYVEAIEWFASLTVEEILEHFGDRYDYIVRVWEETYECDFDIE